MLCNVKKLLVSSVTAFTLFSGAAMAAVPDEAVAMGGIKPGDTLDQAKALWGEPTWQKGKKYNFPNGVLVEVQGSNRFIIEELRCKSPKGPATFNGLSIGSHEKDVSKLYGPADKVKSEGMEVEYIYYSQDRKKKMTIETFYDSVISIECELID